MNDVAFKIWMTVVMTSLFFGFPLLYMGYILGPLLLGTALLSIFVGFVVAVWRN